MRLFAAVDLDPSVRSAARSVAERLGRVLAGPGARRRSGVSWVREENLHLTMRFLGEVDDGRAAELVERFGEPCETATFSIELCGIGIFPPSGPPRVVWIGVTNGADRLAVLDAEVERRMAAAGFGRDDRPFRAHLTIGRVKDALGPSGGRQMLAEPVGSLGTSRVTHVVLYESRLSARGPTYVALARAPLST